jgi:hypothetical protein
MLSLDQRNTEWQAQLMSYARGGELPLLWPFDQLCPDGIMLHIENYALQFFDIPNPVVVRFLLPERPLATSVAVASRGGVAFDTLHDPFARGS